jgi:hypothetical protein
MRQQKMAEGLAVLETHTFFASSSYAKLVQTAFSMQCVTVGARKRVAGAGDPVLSAFVISRGSITVYAPKSGSGSASGDRLSRPGGVFAPLRLALAQWGHGFMIGELEIEEGRAAFGCSYETSTECELFVLPRATLEDVLRHARQRQREPAPAPATKKLPRQAAAVAGTGAGAAELAYGADVFPGHVQRVGRAAAAVRNTFMAASGDRSACATLQSMLPLLGEGPARHTSTRRAAPAQRERAAVQAGAGVGAGVGVGTGAGTAVSLTPEQAAFAIEAMSARACSSAPPAPAALAAATGFRGLHTSLLLTGLATGDPADPATGTGAGAGAEGGPAPPTKPAGSKASSSRAAGGAGGRKQVQFGGGTAGAAGDTGGQGAGSDFTSIVCT